MSETDVTDGRLLRGARTRQAILRHAVDIGSLEGLEALSFGRLASAAGLSKAGVQGLFASKEGLQLAAIDQARAMFVDAVIAPASSAPPGLARLQALLERWIVYAKTPLFAGGCFRVANLAAYDSRPGPVHDALLRDQRDWLGTLAGELRQAVENGEIPDLDVDAAAFEIDAVLCATNTALRLGDRRAVARARRIVAGIVERGS